MPNTAKKGRKAKDKKGKGKKRKASEPAFYATTYTLPHFDGRRTKAQGQFAVNEVIREGGVMTRVKVHGFPNMEKAVEFYEQVTAT